MSIFIVVNYRVKKACWPAFLVRPPLKAWNFIHSVSGMVFAGSILTTTVVEWFVVRHSRRNKSAGVFEFWFENAPKIEQWMVLPALTGSIISGVAQAALSCGCFKLAPRHVKSSLHTLFLIGLWWGLTDRRTMRHVQNSPVVNGGPLPTVVRQRRISNIISCLFLVAIYAIMVLKPGSKAV